MRYEFKKARLFGGPETTCIIEDSRIIKGKKTYQISQIMSVEKTAGIIKIFGVQEELTEEELEALIKEIAHERPRANDQGDWDLLNFPDVFRKLLEKKFPGKYTSFYEWLIYDQILSQQEVYGNEVYEWIRPHSRIDKMNEIYRGLQETDPKIRWGARGEIRKKCNSCGAVYCFTAEDLKRLAKDARASISASLLQAGGLMTGNFGAAIYGKQMDRKVVNLDRCPFCDSSNICDYDPNEDAEASIANNQPSSYSAADEILKFKNLMDQGIITEEEFEAKKKQLLGL